MKDLSKTFARINVLGCSPKLVHGTQTQDMNRDGIKLWNIDTLESVVNEQYAMTEKKIIRYKSLESLDTGEQMVEVRVSSMTEGSGDFVRVKNFYTILKKIDDKVLLSGPFSLLNHVPVGIKNKVKENDQKMQSA